MYYIDNFCTREKELSLDVYIKNIKAYNVRNIN